MWYKCCDVLLLFYFSCCVASLEVCTTLLLIGALHCQFFAELFLWFVSWIMKWIEMVKYRAKKYSGLISLPFEQKSDVFFQSELLNIWRIITGLSLIFFTIIVVLSTRRSAHTLKSWLNCQRGTTKSPFMSLIFISWFLIFCIEMLRIVVMAWGV